MRGARGGRNAARVPRLRRAACGLGVPDPSGRKKRGVVPQRFSFSSSFARAAAPHSPPRHHNPARLLRRGWGVCCARGDVRAVRRGAVSRQGVCGPLSLRARCAQPRRRTQPHRAAPHCAATARTRADVTRHGLGVPSLRTSCSARTFTPPPTVLTPNWHSFALRRVLGQARPHSHVGCWCVRVRLPRPRRVRRCCRQFVELVRTAPQALPQRKSPPGPNVFHE